MSHHAARSIAVIALAAFFVCACDEAPKPPPVVSTATASVAHVPSSRIGRTDSPHIAIKNLDGQIRENERMLKARPDDLKLHGKLVGFYLGRASRLGKFVDFDRAIELAEAALKLAPEDASAWLTHARAMSAVHRFADAQADLDKAASFGAAAATLESSRAGILLGIGRFDEALALAKKVRAAHATTGAIGFEAAVLGRMGKTMEADAVFQEAETEHRGVSAFEVSWLYFEWGAMWDRAGDARLARARYQQAVDRLPQHAHAVGHLAHFVPDQKAAELFAEIMKTSDDPEYAASLAVVQEKLKPGSGAAMLERARAGYDALMKKYPLAFADHAGWFYLDIAKEPERALEVAELNLKNRKVPEAYELMIAALLGSSDEQGACEMAEEALDFAYPSRGVKLFSADAYQACGKKDRAAELRAETNAARAKP